MSFRLGIFWRQANKLFIQNAIFYVSTHKSTPQNWVTPRRKRTAACQDQRWTIITPDCHSPPPPQSDREKSSGKICHHVSFERAVILWDTNDILRPRRSINSASKTMSNHFTAYVLRLRLAPLPTLFLYITVRWRVFAQPCGLSSLSSRIDARSRLASARCDLLFAFESLRVYCSV